MEKKLRRFNLHYIIYSCLTVLLFYITPVVNAETKPLILAVHPYLPAVEIQKRFTPLVKYLAKQLSVPIKLQISQTYESHIENIGNQVVDIAYLGPASYVELTNEYGNHPLLACLEVNGKPYFNGYIITKDEKLVGNIASLKGKRFAFGSPHSTMSYLVPKYMLKQAGVDLDTLDSYQFLGNHRNVALGVLLGEFDAGAVKEEIYFAFKKEGIKKVAISPSISEHLFIAKKAMAKDTIEQLQQAMYALGTNAEDVNTLTKIKKNITGLVKVSDRDYDSLRNVLHQ